ncbi:outer membrane receptor protein involved in Fe transport [Pedobacter cryoconitis]|uniref:outer membrane beta-barrel family protein n=1 Tax=Pedobacter cryoconitis TaxID=188932 RepID=UPI00160B520E|nr:outer membrane beta-barrel family protein [Pedobacter cryoconitis]MBB6271216.1 outer membrane receptor protein involved in Fe transport [Pedobacter cryoconitis]
MKLFSSLIMRIAVILLFIIANSFLSEAQSIDKGEIKGAVVDSVTNAGVDFATVSLFKAGAPEPFILMNTNQKGEFHFVNILPGVYRLTIDFIGYRRKIINPVVIAAKMPGLALGNIRLSAAGNVLREVVIQAKVQVMENKADKLVYNAAADITSQSGVATDVLKKVPMVSVDIDGNVELQGNANVRFLINGKPANIFGSKISDVLQSVPASQIKNIEVMTSPGAKYDAAGTAGIINLVLKDNLIKGINGSVNLSAGTRLENGSFNLNARNKNLGLSAFFSANKQLNSNIANLGDRLSFNSAKDTLTRYVQDRFSPFTKSGYQSGLSMDWNITSKDVLTATVGLNQNITHGTGRIMQNQQTYLSTGRVLSDITSERTDATDFGGNSQNWSLLYKKTFLKEGRELNFAYVASATQNKNYDSQLTSYQNGAFPNSGIKSDNPGNDRETDISIDYVEPLAKNFKIETGVKAVFENINNSVVTDSLLNDGTFVNNPGQTYKFNFTRKIYAGYISTSFSLFNDFLNGKAGIRYERTDIHSDLSNDAIPGNNIWAPNLLIQHKLNETQSVKFSYAYRIQRPDYGDLNPFLEIIDPRNISTGNPELKNETGRKFELGYSKSFANSSSLYIGVLYNRNSNDIQHFTTFFPVYVANGTTYNNVSLTKTANIGSQTTLGLNISGSAVINDKLSLRANLLLLKKNNLVPGLPSVGGFSYNANLNATYKLREDLVAEAFGMIDSKRTDFQSIRPGSYNYTIAIRKQLFSNRASIGVTTTNPFNHYTNQYSSAYGTGFTQTNLRQQTMRSFGVIFGYKFDRIRNNKEGAS